MSAHSALIEEGSSSVRPTSVLQLPELTENFRYWLAKKLESKGFGKAVIPESKEFIKALDAIQNRSFAALKDQQTILGLAVTQYGRTGIRPPEFNLLEHAAVYDAEPLVRSAITRQLNLWFKQDLQLVGPKKAYVDYIGRRLKQIAFVTKIPTRELFRKIVRSLLRYSNAFVIIVRNQDYSGGIKKEGVKKAPIAGLFPVSPLSMFPKFENGILISWIRLLSDGTRFQEFHPEDVIHFTFDREEDFIFGKPRLLGAIEDVAALRRMEENVEVLVSRYLFPIYHLMVGSAEIPCRYFPDGSSEIDAARIAVQEMEQEGMLITSERMKLELIGALDKALNAQEYLKHFKIRLYADLGVSAVDMGEGDTANRSTADNISQNLKDKVLEDQQHFADQVQLELFLPFFLEHPEDISAINAFDSVRLSFFNCDLDSRLKFENHVINLVNNDLTTFEEGRQMLGKQPLTDKDWKDTHLNRVDIPLIKEEAKAKMEIAQMQLEAQTKLAKQQMSLQAEQHEAQLKSQEKQTKLALAHPKAQPQVHVGTQAPTIATGTGGGTGNKTGGAKGGAGRTRPGTSASRTTATKSQPTNQHGKALGPTKKKSSFDEDGNFIVRDSRDQSLIGPVLSRIIDMVMLCDTQEEAEQLINHHFADNPELPHILSIVTYAFTNAKAKHELRAGLFAAALTIADRFSEDQDAVESMSPGSVYTGSLSA